MTKVIWCVISTAKNGLKRALPGMLKSDRIEIRAIASRSAKAAGEAADNLGIPKAYGSYDELLADPQIEAVYNPLPNHLHVPFALRAAGAGKHELCEKPSALVDFGAGRHLDFTVSTQCLPFQRIQMCAYEGRIEIQIPVNAPQGASTLLFVDTGGAPDGSSVRTET